MGNLAIKGNETHMTAKELINKIKDLNISSHDIPIFVDMKHIKKVELIGSENGCAVLVTTYEPLKVKQHESTKM